MVSADVALANLMNRTATAYVQNAPAFIVYRERTHVTASMGRSQDIDRSVKVRQADNYAVMQDLPNGAERTGQAFPIIPYFDPFSNFNYSWFANLKRVDITLNRAAPSLWPLPGNDAGVDVVVPYISFWAPSYVADSAPARLHFRVLPTPALTSGQFFPYDVAAVLPGGLPSHIELRFVGDPTSITLDYQSIAGYWVITHARYSAPQHVGPFNFSVVSDTTYDQFKFPATAPDPRLAAVPHP